MMAQSDSKTVFFNLDSVLELPGIATSWAWDMAWAVEFFENPESRVPTSLGTAVLRTKMAVSKPGRWGSLGMCLRLF